MGKETNVPYIQGEVHFYFGKMYKDKGDREKAREHLNFALRIFESLETEDFIQKVRTEMEGL